MGSKQILVEKYTKLGDLTIIVKEEDKKDKTYIYEGLNEFQFRKLKKIMKTKSIGNVFQFLKQFRIESYE